MHSLIEGLRQIIGQPAFVLSDGSWDYGSMLEYLVCAIIVCVVVSAVFRFLGKLVDR